MTVTPGALSGVITLDATVQALIDYIPAHQLIYLAIDQDNANEVYIGNDGADSIAVGTGFVLHKNGTLGVELHYSKWKNMLVKGTNGEKITWLARG